MIMAYRKATHRIASSQRRHHASRMFVVVCKPILAIFVAKNTSDDRHRASRMFAVFVSPSLQYCYKENI